MRKPPALLGFAGIPSGSHALENAAGTLIQVADARVPHRPHVGLLRLDLAARLLVTGPDGARKSTLLGLLAGTVVPRSGSVTRRRDCASAC